MKVADLITDVATRAEGFEAQAAKKSQLMKPYIEHGLIAISILQKGVVKFSTMDKTLQDFLIAAAGLSRKSLNHLDQKTIEKIIDDILPMNKLHDSKVQSDLLYRFLLTSGDSLGGSMRNIVGDLGQTKLVETMLEILDSKTIKHRSELSSSEKISSISWAKQIFLFNKKPKFLDKSIDIIVLVANGDIENPNHYLACGELKSGIDPAGADEHWKTAKSALARIRDNFDAKKISPPYLFFIGAAIENSMAKEAVEMMGTGTLNLAVNLYKEDQLKQLIEELLNLR
jgi:type II restriction enzyme